MTDMPMLPDSFAPVIADLRRSGYVVTVRAVSTLLFHGGTGYFEFHVNHRRIGMVSVDDLPLPAAGVVGVADQVSVAMTDTVRAKGVSVSWPPCPDGNMPMKPTLIAGQPMWVSPYDPQSRLSVPIGEWS